MVNSEELTGTTEYLTLLFYFILSYLSCVLCTTLDMFYILPVNLLWIHGTLNKIELN
jgi:hypothetical protein